MTGSMSIEGSFLPFLMVEKRERIVVREEFLYAHKLFDEMPK